MTLQDVIKKKPNAPKIVVEPIKKKLVTIKEDIEEKAPFKPLPVPSIKYTNLRGKKYSRK